MRPDLLITDDVAGEASKILLDSVRHGGHVVLTGGSTPKDTYRRAAAANADWSKTELWFSDERCVPPDHEHSNFRMAQETLLDNISAKAVHRMRGELGPSPGATQYENEIEQGFEGGMPEFDLILLGLGPDSHCASLFPGNPELGEREKWAVGVETPGMAPLVPRITLTLPVLNAGKTVVFLVEGESKAEAMARAFSGQETPNAPASLVRPRGRYLLVCDSVAATYL